MNQFSPQELSDAQLLDGELCPVIKWLEGEPPSQNDFHTQGIELTHCGNVGSSFASYMGFCIIGGWMTEEFQY